VYMAETVWKLQYSMKHYPEVRFHFTSEIDKEESRTPPRALQGALSA
jgi:hypothetical protein